LIQLSTLANSDAKQMPVTSRIRNQKNGSMMMIMASDAQAATAAMAAKARMCPELLSSHGVIQQPTMKPK
jgi:hypothetical protein